MSQPEQSSKVPTWALSMLIAGFVGSAYFWTKGAFEHGTARELFNGFVLGSEFMMIGNAVESRRQSAKKA